MVNYRAQIFAFLLFSFYGCNNLSIKKAKKNYYNNSVESSFLYKSKQVDSLVEILDNASCLYNSHIGIEGHKSPTYYTLDKLLEVSNDSTLLDIVLKSKKLAKIYSYNALVDMESPLAIKAQIFLKNDSMVFCYKTNDIKINFTIANYVTKYKTPTVHSLK